MTDKLKELIQKAPIKRKGTFKSFLIVSNGVYDGIFGINGFNSIILLGFDIDKKEYVKITDYADIFYIYNVGENVSFNLDIPTEYGVPRIYFGRPITIDNEINISSVNGRVIKMTDTEMTIERAIFSIDSELNALQTAIDDELLTAIQYRRNIADLSIKFVKIISYLYNE